MTGPTAPTEPHVHRMMRRLAKEPTERNRFALYTALLDAHLVVPLRPEAVVAEGQLPTLADLAQAPGQGREKPVFIVFTDDVGLVRWRDGGGPRARLAGAVLFPMFAAGPCGGLRINPEGRIGGMLYGHEVETMAEAAVRRFARG